MSKKEPRFDVSCDGGYWIDYHFCRGWDVDPETGEQTGCYGTNPDHGYTFDEAREYIIEQLEGEAKYWREMTFKKWEAQ